LEIGRVNYSQGSRRALDDRPKHGVVARKGATSHVTDRTIGVEPTIDGAQTGIDVDDTACHVVERKCRPVYNKRYLGIC